jgi:alkaline phosphatase
MRKTNIIRCLFVLFSLAGVTFAQDGRAKNVVLFLADAGGIPTLHAASVYAHNAPQQLYIHGMPHIGLSETSAASQWVTDSAAGMTAIVTGWKTHNGVIAQSAVAQRGKRDGEALKTILEYAEERGLSTGVITNSSVLSATPAATYAHVNDRDNEVDIFRQLLRPRFGDGVDVVFGAGRRGVFEAAKEAGLDVKSAFEKAGLGFYLALEEIPPKTRRAVVLLDEDFDLAAATEQAIRVLSQNPKGFFLMVESDVHTEKLIKGFDNVIKIDRAIQQTAERMKNDTLILFTADHSYDLRINGGRKDQPLVPASTPTDFGDNEGGIKLENLRREDDHTGEQVIVAAEGPGAERVRGFLSNTELFHIMMAAFGWK